MAPNNLSQIAADLPWLDSLEAHRRLRAAGLAPLLLESAGPHPEAQRSFIGLSPHVEVRITGRAIEEHWADGAIELFEADPGAHLRRLTDRFRFALDEPAGFTGGWMGYFGFGFAGALEPTLPEPPSSLVPDVVLRLCLDALVFERGTLRLHCAELEGAPPAAGRMAAIRAALAKPSSAQTTDSTEFTELGIRSAQSVESVVLGSRRWVGSPGTELEFAL